MSMKFIPRFISAALAISFLFYVPVPSAYAATNEADYWRWWYINQQSGADISDAENTDYGISAGEYAKNKTGYTVNDAIQEVTEQYNNAVDATANGIDYYYNAVRDVYNHSVDYAERGAYMAEDALRKTVDTAGNYVYAVNSSDFWNGFYNSMYNGGGYKDQYSESVNNNSYTIPTNAGNVIIDVYIANKQRVGGIVESPIFINGGELVSANYNNVVIKATYNGESVYYGVTGDNRDILYIYENGVDISIPTQTRISVGVHYNDGWNTFSTVTIDLKDTITGNASNNTTPTLLPSQMGFIVDPLTGDKVPVYTDTTQNPFIINPDGTVTLPTGDVVPIYVDPNEISEDGWLWILDFIDKQDNTKPSQNPFGQPWNTQDDGTVLGGLFNNLLQDISSLFDDIANKINDLLNRMINLITDALKKFFILLVGDVEDYGNLFETSEDSHIDMIEELYNLLLQVVGVDT